MDLTPLLPLRAVRVDFIFIQDTPLRFFHQPLLAGLLRNLMKGELNDEPRLWLAAPDSGRGRFDQGDAYHFHLFCCAGAEPLLGRLLDRLRRLPDAFPAKASKPALGPNLRFRSARDYFTGEPYRGIAALYAYDAAALARETDFYHGLGPISLRLLTPARLLRPKQHRGKGETRFVRDRGELNGPLIGDRLHDSLAHLLESTGTSKPARGPSGIEGMNDDCGWLDAAYYDEEGGENPMGGIIGALQVGSDSPAQLAALVLGQYTGIGQRRAFGWGRYRLETAQGQGTLPPRSPSRTVLDRAAEPVNIELAWRAILTNRRPEYRDPELFNPDALAWSQHSPQIDRLLERIATELREGDYHAETLRGLIQHREGRAPRPLAVPPFADRIAQRAVIQVLQADLADLHSTQSYGYRQGMSRLGARDRIQALYRQGYHWVYEADIEDFFDSVSHQRLATRLRSLLTDDPVVELLLAWIAAPVHYHGETIPRPSGLPQGSPVSPMLANLLLDDFDSDLENLGFKLVRFADDFVILCKSLAEAERAGDQVRASLAEIDLAVNPLKSGVREMDRGLRFLGYNFLGDIAVEGHAPRKLTDGQLRLGELPPLSWLACAARANPALLQPEPQEEVTAETPPAEIATAFRLHGEATGGCHLALVTEGSLLSTRNGRLRVNDQEYPWHSLAAVLLVGRQRITWPCMTAALEAGVPIHFAARGGKYLGALSAENGDHLELQLQQQAAFRDKGLCLTLARELTAARIHNQIETLRLRLHGLSPQPDPIAAMRQQAEAIARTAGLAELNGYEGMAAKHYFEGIGHLLPEAFGFAGRERRPPPDPFNAMLSLGYTLLYQRIDAVVRSAGLNPRAGFYHQSHGRHAALASDLMEPFRHLVERQALAMINRGQIKIGDFTPDPGRGVIMSTPAAKCYITALTERFIKPMENAVGGESLDLHGHVWRLAQCLIGLIRGTPQPFRPFRVK